MSAVPSYESMCRLKICDLRIRVWREEATLELACAADNDDLHRWFRAYTSEIVERGGLPAMFEIFSLIKAFPRVAAVEILDAEMQGAVWYSDWP